MDTLIDKKNFDFVKAEYPIGFVDSFLDENMSKNLCREIENFSGFDDLVMSGRKRVNKGSKKFEEYLRKYPNICNLYNQLNSEKSFIEFWNLLLKENNNIWKPIIKNYKFSKTGYGEQSFNLLKYFRKTHFVSGFFNKTVNLDMDFSKSEFGYFREAHRDRDTRIISFLLYLNTIEKEEGGSFEIYKCKKFKKDLGRFPKNFEVEKTHSFPPKAGQLFIFLSSPNSYHGVSKFLSKDKSRVFIYGSYSLDRKVKWVSA